MQLNGEKLPLPTVKALSIPIPMTPSLNQQRMSLPMHRHRSFSGVRLCDSLLHSCTRAARCTVSPDQALVSSPSKEGWLEKRSRRAHRPYSGVGSQCAAGVWLCRSSPAPVAQAVVCAAGLEAAQLQGGQGVAAAPLAASMQAGM